MRSYSGHVTAAASVNCGTITKPVGASDIQTSSLFLLSLPGSVPFHTKGPSQKSRTLKELAFTCYNLKGWDRKKGGGGGRAERNKSPRMHLLLLQFENCA